MHLLQAKCCVPPHTHLLSRREHKVNYSNLPHWLAEASQFHLLFSPIMPVFNGRLKVLGERADHTFI